MQYLGRVNFPIPVSPKLFLDFFSGSGHLWKALRAQLGHAATVVEIDFLHGPQFDLTKRSLQRFVANLIKKHRVIMVWLGTPCTTWSRARRGGGSGPPPIRTNEHIWGLPHLSDCDQNKINKGNLMLKFSAYIFRLCIRHKVAVALENPHSSMLWQTPQMKYLLQHREVDSDYTDFCQEGCLFRKRTRIM